MNYTNKFEEDYEERFEKTEKMVNCFLISFYNLFQRNNLPLKINETLNDLDTDNLDELMFYFGEFKRSPNNGYILNKLRALINKIGMAKMFEIINYYKCTNTDNKTYMIADIQRKADKGMFS